MKIIDKEDFNSNYELCKECGGYCCMRNACNCSPEDFENDVSKMREALETGNYTIDFAREDATSFVFRGDEIILDTNRIKEKSFEFLYIRPRNYNRPFVDFFHTEEDEGPCIFWNVDSGCPFKYKQRPKGGRTMVPFPKRKCLLQYNKLFMIQEWKPFEEELVKLAKEFFDKNWSIYKTMNFSIE